MSYLTKNHSIFILGPDVKLLMRDALRSYDFFYFEQGASGVVWNLRILMYTAWYFLKLTTLSVSLISILKSAYFTALIKVSARDIVITAIDNNIHFFRAAKTLHHQLRFIVVQNGTKFYKNHYMYKDMADIMIPELICYGEYDRVSLSTGPAKIEHFYPLGSAYEIKSREKSAIYEKFKNGIRDIKYGICLISEDYSSFTNEFPGIVEISDKITTYCERYCKENDLKLVIALKNKPGSSKRESEIKSFIRTIDVNDTDIILSENKNWWSSYDLAIESQISIGMASSMLYENSSRGLKVLICDFYGEDWSMGAKQPLVLKSRSPSYLAFKNAVDMILNQSHKDYFDEREKQIRYVINNYTSGTFDAALKNIIETPPSGYNKN